jgi:hypothetical protein
MFLAALLTTNALPAAGASPAGARPTWELVLADSTEPGPPFVLEGRVYALPDSQPLGRVQVKVWHADASGSYGRGGRYARLEGSVTTNVAGGFRVRSVLPGPAEGFAHVHFSVSGTGIETRAGTLNLARSHGAGSNAPYAKLPYMLSPTAQQTWSFVEPDDVGFHATCRLYVKRVAPR